MTRRKIASKEILSRLSETYPDAKCALEHESPFQLLIATILSAQCTDKRVNIITARLFPKCPTPAHFVALTQAELEQEIRDCGLFRDKARNIRETCRLLLERHGGEVPDRMEDLVKLPGVGRKTANVVLSNAFGVPAIAVDTHVFRVANRLGLATADDVLETEKQLMARIPREQWSQAHHWLIHHGRSLCHARGPRCAECPLLALCPAGKQEVAAGGKRKPAARAPRAGRKGAPAADA